MYLSKVCPKGRGVAGRSKRGGWVARHKRDGKYWKRISEKKKKKGTGKKGERHCTAVKS